MYRVEAVIGLVVLLATFALLRHDETTPPGETAPLDRRSAGFAGFRSLRRIHGWLALTVAYAAFGFMYLLVFAFLVARLEDDAGFTSRQASLMFSLVGVATIFGGLLFGPLSDRIGRRSTLVLGFTVFAASALAILPGRQPWVALGSIGAGLAFSGRADGHRRVRRRGDRRGDVRTGVQRGDPRLWCGADGGPAGGWADRRLA